MCLVPPGGDECLHQIAQLHCRGQTPYCRVVDAAGEPSPQMAAVSAEGGGQVQPAGRSAPSCGRPRCLSVQRSWSGCRCREIAAFYSCFPFQRCTADFSNNLWDLDQTKTPSYLSVQRQTCFTAPLRPLPRVQEDLLTLYRHVWPVQRNVRIWLTV